MSHTQPNRTDANDELRWAAQLQGRPVGRYRRGDVRAWINTKRRGTNAS